MCYPQILKYEIKERTGIHSPNEVEDSFVKDIQSTTYETQNPTSTSNEFYVWLAEEVSYFI